MNASVVIVGLVACAIGLAVGWFVESRRRAAVTEVAVAEARNALQIELATMTERLSAFSLSRETERQEYESLQKVAAERQTRLDAASHDIARLEERSSQLGQKLNETQQSLEALIAKSEADTRAFRQTEQMRAGFEQQVSRIPELEAQLKQARDRLAALTEEHAALRTLSDGERRHAQEKLQLLIEAKEELSNQFKSLATDILEEKSKRFAEQNQVSIGQLLEPLKVQINEFKGKVEEVYVNEGKDRSALSEQVKQLVALNQTLSEDAKNLTMALKGQAKTQGNWGELILERVLEASGLRRGYEYKIQDSQVREDGSRAQPDVIIELPEGRKLVVDAKVSLVAYERYVADDSEEGRANALRQHLDSVRSHIKGLSGKKYEQLYGIASLDFVLAFIPIEPAFMLAVTSDSELFMDAWNRNVLLVSPSTLLFVVRTVAHLWRQEAQSRNAQDIAKRGAELYDKLHGFVADLEKVGDSLGRAKDAYDLARNKLVTGRGNVIRQAEMLKSMGVKPSKSLPGPLVEAALEADGVQADEIALAAPLDDKKDEEV
jgi:DNA recombination protein RmuC